MAVPLIPRFFLFHLSLVIATIIRRRRLPHVPKFCTRNLVANYLDLDIGEHGRADAGKLSKVIRQVYPHGPRCSILDVVSANTAPG